LKELGVSRWVVIHSPEGAFGIDENGAYLETESAPLSKSAIKGTVGAGDAFCAGVLCGAYRGLSLGDAVELGNASAACSLTESGATEGMRTAEEAMAFCRHLRAQAETGE
jgi:sugar/nucleoside kinase (ribokinase family)